MQRTAAEQLEQILRDVKATIPGVEAVAVISTEGLTIASVLTPAYDEIRVVAVTAAMLSMGQTATRELGRTTLDEVYVRSPEGYVVLHPAGSQAAITVFLNKDAKLGLVFLNLRRAADQIGQILESF
jgi:hypothetical protein